MSQTFSGDGDVPVFNALIPDWSLNSELRYFASRNWRYPLYGAVQTYFDILRARWRHLVSACEV